MFINHLDKTCNSVTDSRSSYTESQSEKRFIRWSPGSRVKVQYCFLYVTYGASYLSFSSVLQLTPAGIIICRISERITNECLKVNPESIWSRISRIESISVVRWLIHSFEAGWRFPLRREWMNQQKRYLMSIDSYHTPYPLSHGLKT